VVRELSPLVALPRLANPTPGSPGLEADCWADRPELSLQMKCESNVDIGVHTPRYQADDSPPSKNGVPRHLKVEIPRGSSFVFDEEKSCIAKSLFGVAY
jgi:hypothetical protein